MVGLASDPLNMFKDLSAWRSERMSISSKTNFIRVVGPFFSYHNYVNLVIDHNTSKMINKNMSLY